MVFFPLTPHVLERIHSHKGSGSCAILPHLNCWVGGGFLTQYFLFFSLLFLILFLFLLFDRFIIFYSCVFCTTEGRKTKGRLSIIKSIKGKRKCFLWDVRGCNDDSKNTKYWIPHWPFFTPLYTYFLSSLPLPAWLLSSINKINNYLRHKWQCSDSTIHNSWCKHNSYTLLPKFKRSSHIFICLPNYLQVLFLKTDCPQFGKYFHQRHKNSGRILKSTLQMWAARSSLFTTDFPILILEIC